MNLSNQNQPYYSEIEVKAMLTSMFYSAKHWKDVCENVITHAMDEDFALENAMALAFTMVEKTNNKYW